MPFLFARFVDIRAGLRHQTATNPTTPSTLHVVVGLVVVSMVLLSLLLVAVETERVLLLRPRVEAGMLMLGRDSTARVHLATAHLVEDMLAGKLTHVRPAVEDVRTVVVVIVVVVGSVCAATANVGKTTSSSCSAEVVEITAVSSKIFIS